MPRNRRRTNSTPNYPTSTTNSGTTRSISRARSCSATATIPTNQTSSSIGSNNNAYIIIDGEAHIRRNVYGGGNYGSAGTQYDGTATTVIDILSGTIVDSIYGASKSAGFSRNNYTDRSSININVELI